MSFSPLRQSFLEREREDWRNATDQRGKEARLSAIGAGPTVDDLDYDADVDDQWDFTSYECTWTEQEEMDAKWSHLNNIIEGNDSYDVIMRGDEGDALRLTVTWVMAMRN